MKRKKIHETPIDWLQRCLDQHLTHEQKMQFDGLFQQANEMLLSQHIIERQFLIAFMDTIKEKYGIDVCMKHIPYREGGLNCDLCVPTISSYSLTKHSNL